MSRSANRFDETAATDSVCADKGTLDPLIPSDDPVARDEQERQLDRILQGGRGRLPAHHGIDFGTTGSRNTSSGRSARR